MGRDNRKEGIGCIDDGTLGPSNVGKSDIEEHIIDRRLQKPLPEYIRNGRPLHSNQSSLQHAGHRICQYARQEEAVARKQYLAARPLYMKHLIAYLYTRKCAAP